MKYMTKDWYETMQKTDLHLLLKVSKKAAVFSEDYFKELYKREEKKWLQLQSEVSEVQFEDICVNVQMGTPPQQSLAVADLGCRKGQTGPVPPWPQHQAAACLGTGPRAHHSQDQPSLHICLSHYQS